MPGDFVAGGQRSYICDRGPTSSLEDLKTAGGYDHEAISHGFWPKAGHWKDATTYTGSYEWYGFGLQSHYHYRNVPTAIARWDNLAKDGEDFDGYDAAATHMVTHPLRVYLGLTKPRVMVEIGCPPFKTQKILGGRALVSDSFSWFNEDPSHGPHAGYGIYAHRDGYNVLYGDWSAKWYGDPQRGIMWPTPNWIPRSPGNLDYDGAWTSTDVNFLCDYYGLTGDQDDDSNRDCSSTIWHILDTAAAIDVDAD